MTDLMLQCAGERETQMNDMNRHSKREAPTRAFATIAFVLLTVGCAFGGDWPNWRGPQSDGHAEASGLPSEFSLLWKAPHGGRSTPVVQDGRVFVVNRAGTGVDEQERIMCFDEKTGDALWEHRFSVFLTDIPSTRIGWASPVVDPETGYVYAHGVQNTFTCLDRDGQVIWKRQLHEEYGTINGYGGRTHTPIIDEDRVVISFLNASWGPQAPGRHRFLAMDKRTGAVIWWSQPGGPPLDTTYAMPVVTEIDGVRQLILGNADGAIYGIQARTGVPIWSFKLSKRGINVSIVVSGKHVFACHSEENVDESTMGRVVCIDATGKGDVTKTHEVWRHGDLLVGYSSPALADGRLFVCDNSANVHCLDAKTGKTVWEQNVGTVMKGSPVVADGKIYLCEVNGNFLIRDAGTGKELAKKHFQVQDGVVEMFGSPAVANGRVFFNTRDAIYCLGKPGGEGLASKTLAVPAAKAGPAATLQIVPADVVVHSGQNVVFGARTFDANGNVKGSVQPVWSVVGFDGTIGTAGRLEVADQKGPAGYGHGFVVAKVGDLEHKARVRVVPKLPFEANFTGVTEGKPPVGFVGAGIKFVGAKYKGEPVLTKPGKRSKFMDAETFFGVSTWENYTVEADVLALEKKRNLPNVGVVNSGYDLVLMGNHQRLRIVSWVPQPRLEQKVRFKWDPEVWYRMKFKVVTQGGVAKLYGKVWPRDEKEPEAWTVEATDPNPNPAGGPALHGYSAGARAKSAGAQIFYDNVRVTSN